jgi:hypothetical protein
MTLIDRTRLSRRALLGGGMAATATHATQTFAQTRATTAAAFAAPAAPSAPNGLITVTARKIETFSRTSDEKRFGRLTFRGGLVLTSDNKDFGGLSGIDIEADGKSFVAITDEGHWLTGHLTYDGTAPSGLTNVRQGPIFGIGGRALTRKRDLDAEACTILEGTLARGTVLIAFERNHRIGRFPVVDRVIQPPVANLKLPPEAQKMRSNQGLEAMSVLRGGPYKGSVIALSERFPDPAGQHVGWLWINGEPQRFGLRNIDGFDITDVNSLPDGTVLILERRFRWTEGVKMQLRLVKPAELQPGAMINGEVLISADMGYDIDNMEGLGVHRTAKSETILTLISDDNFNHFLQRTILLQFALA